MSNRSDDCCLLHLPMKTTAAFLLLALCPLMAAEKTPAPETATQLVDRMIMAPGEFDQMCDAPDPIDPKLPLPIYKLVADRDVHLSPENIEELKKRRAEVVQVLVKRLAAYDFTNQPKMPPVKRKYREDMIEVSGINPRQLSGLLYEMIVGLDAVETLPELLRLEEQLRSLIAKASENKKVTPPVVYMDGYVTMPRGKDVLSTRDQALSKGRVVQRELLSVMLQLLRGQKFAPLIESDIEKTYGIALKALVAEDEDLKDIKTPEDAKAKGKEWLKFDPIHNVPQTYFREQPSLPFSAETRNLVRGLVEQYLKTAPKKG